MDSNDGELRIVLARVANLERENRRFKRAAAIAALLGTALLAMAQTRTPGQVKASRFDLVDAGGKTVASLHPVAGGSTLELLDSRGNAAVWLSGGDLAGGLDLSDTAAPNKLAQRIVSLRAVGQSSEPELKMLYGPENAMLSVNAGLSLVTLSGSAVLRPHKTDRGIPGPALDLVDSDGFNVVLGKDDLEAQLTGSKHSTSAAFLGMFDKDGKLIWSTPH